MKCSLCSFKKGVIWFGVCLLCAECHLKTLERLKARREVKNGDR